MPTPSFFVGYPDGWITKRPWLHADTAQLFVHIQHILNEKGHKFELGRIKTTSPKYDINLAHHTTYTQKNVWNLKKGYIPGYVYWDRTGYSGWSEMANNRALFEKSQEVDYDEAREFFDEFTATYINNNVSKFPQKVKAGQDLKIKPDDGTFSCSTPYVFVACQRPRDTVAHHARVKTEHLPELVANAFVNSGYTVVIKRHPQEDAQVGANLVNMPHVVFSQHSIHQIIPNASAVITVNSGVGFESLLHRKPVYTSGHSDYHWSTRPINNKADVQKIKETLEVPFEEERNVKFIYYMLNNYFANAYDSESIRKKIDMCIEEWRNK